MSVCNELQNIINHCQNVFCSVLVNMVLVLYIVPAWVLHSNFKCIMEEVHFLVYVVGYNCSNWCAFSLS